MIAQAEERNRRASGVFLQPDLCHFNPLHVNGWLPICDGVKVIASRTTKAAATDLLGTVSGIDDDDASIVPS